MSKLVLNDVAAGSGGQATINTNNQATEIAVENTLSRDGTAPNMMGADIDMNGHCLLNVGCVTEGPSVNSIDIQTFATPGNFTIATNTINGMMFSYTGSFITTGSQDIILYGTGTPVMPGNYIITPEIVGPHPLGGQACSFFVTVN